MHTESPDQLNITAQVANTVEMKATRARRTATINYVLTMIIGLGILSLFLFAGPLTEAIKIEQLQKAAAKSTEIARMQLATLQEDVEKTTGLIHSLVVVQDRLSLKAATTTPEAATVPNAASQGSQPAKNETQPLQIEDKTTSIESPSLKALPKTSTTTNIANEKADSKSWWESLFNDLQGDTVATFANSIIARIGAVLIAIFLIQILLSFARYNYRLSEHLSACADMIRLSAGDTDKMRNLALFMLPAIEFGKIPSSPFQKIVDTSMDTIKELAKKVPTR
jgi:hypothetical protein